MSALAPARPIGLDAPTFSGLNPAQRRAVEYGIGAGDLAHGPLLVIAGAGSGKTLTLAARVARLVLAGADPARILLLTFSRRAALEMERRVGRVLNEALGLAPSRGAPRLAWCGTFHAIGARLLRAHAAALGLDPAFTVDDRSESEDLIHVLRQRLGLAAGRRRFPQKATCLAIYSRVVNAQASLAEVLQGTFPWCSDAHDELRRLFAAYVAEKEAQRVLDFDDLLVWWAAALAEPALRAAMAARFDHVLVDEYQDTNRLQAAILLGLKPDGRGLTVVGDDAQSIYSFRAATVRNILDFPGHFRPPADVVTLEQNYRSTQPILNAANAVIGLADERFTKNLWSERKSASARKSSACATRRTRRATWWRRSWRAARPGWR
jgi:DNA helicase-2/ATP-dependent DNA helicase PcrA